MVLALWLAPSAAFAHPTKGQQACITTMNKAALKLATALAKDTTKCVRDAGKDRLVDVTAQECLTADEKGRIEKLRLKLLATESKKCLNDPPPFGYSSATRINTRVPEEQLRMVESLFGVPLEDGIAVAGRGNGSSGPGKNAKCQLAVVKACEKFAGVRLKEFNSCKIRGIKTETIEDVGGIEACVVADPKEKVAKARNKLVATVEKRCKKLELASVFPGECRKETADETTLGECLARQAECHTCVVANDVDRLRHNCDLQDDGSVNGSCRTCGNGFVEAPEQCDDRAESETCDDDCTLAVCGDGYHNLSAGEACDDGNFIDGDGCDSNCTPTACGNGVLSDDEECDDGRNDDGDGCTAECVCEPGSIVVGCQDPQCPNKAELVVVAGASTPCQAPEDCPAGQCDLALGRCVTETADDIGYTGIVHDVDTNDGVSMTLELACPGPQPLCGECLVRGIDPQGGNCRCATDSSLLCDEPFQVDEDDCGGDVCSCYDGPPAPAVQGGVPVCLVWRYSRDVSGTMNVDTGDAVLNKDMRTVVYVGEALLAPCPYCDGDVTPNDGTRDGTCTAGQRVDMPCDVGAINTTFPAPGGGGHSLDCMPDIAKNFSGVGVRVDQRLTTGASGLDARLVCGFESMPQACPCGVCSDDSSVACTSNVDCLGGGVCGALDFGVPRANDCTDGVCTDMGSEGVCDAGPEQHFCDGIVRANGRPFVSCVDDQSCADTDCGGGGCGFCTQTELRACFPDQVVVAGVADPAAPIRVATYCMPAVSPGVDAVNGLPGPGRSIRQELASYPCASDPLSNYLPGVGGCPPPPPAE